MWLTSRPQHSGPMRVPDEACWLQPEGGCAAHDFLERGLEPLHFLTGADGDANAGGPDRPDASDEDVTFSGRGPATFVSALAMVILTNMGAPKAIQSYDLCSSANFIKA